MERRDFIITGLQTVLVSTVCQASEVAKKGHGILCLTFDDRNFAGWKSALPVFDKYGAHATFFVCGALDDEAVATMTVLQKAGHSLGLHGLTHAAAPKMMKSLGASGFLAKEVVPQLEVAKRARLNVRSWAYPMSARNPETDAALGAQFRRLRTGCVWRTEIKNHPLCACDGVFVPAGQVAKCALMRGTSFPSAFEGWEEDVVGALRRVREKDELLCLYAHDIVSGERVDAHDLSLRQLDFTLAKAVALGVSVLGFDEL